MDLPHISNFTDLDPFRIEPDVRLRVVRCVPELTHYEAALRYASTAVTVGASRDEAARALESAFTRLAPGKEGEKK